MIRKRAGRAGAQGPHGPVRRQRTDSFQHTVGRTPFFRRPTRGWPGQRGRRRPGLRRWPHGRARPFPRPLPTPGQRGVAAPLERGPHRREAAGETAPVDRHEEANRRPLRAGPRLVDLRDALLDGSVEIAFRLAQVDEAPPGALRAGLFQGPLAGRGGSPCVADRRENLVVAERGERGGHPRLALDEREPAASLTICRSSQSSRTTVFTTAFRSGMDRALITCGNRRWTPCAPGGGSAAACTPRSCCAPATAARPGRCRAG